MFTSVLRQLAPALRAMVVLTVLLGLAYPLALTGFAQVAVHGKANGSLLKVDGKVVGSSLIGQSFDGEPQYFQSRPSAAGDGYDPRSMAGTATRWSIRSRACSATPAFSTSSRAQLRSRRKSLHAG